MYTVYTFGSRMEKHTENRLDILNIFKCSLSVIGVIVNVDSHWNIDIFGYNILVITHNIYTQREQQWQRI